MELVKWKKNVHFDYETPETENAEQLTKKQKT